MSRQKANARIIFKNGSSRDFVASNGQSAFGCYNIWFIDEQGKTDSLSYPNCMIKMVIDLVTNAVVHKPD